MRQIGEDSFLRGRDNRPKPRSFSIRLPVLVFLSLALIVLSRLGHPTVKELRARAEALMAPAMAAAMVPLGPLRRLVRHVQESYESFATLEKLRDENQRLRQWESRAHALERRVVELSQLAKALDEQKIEFRTVRVIASSTGAFLQSALLEAGSEHGIKTGHPVINADGVLGRIVETGRRTARVLLLTDINSRVPVLVGKQQARALVVGDGGPEPRLSFLAPGASIEPGDEIATSGLGGMFPRGLRVGTVNGASGGSRVEPAARLGEQQYASVLLYDNPGVALALELGQANPAPVEPVTRRRPAAERGARP